MARNPPAGAADTGGMDPRSGKIPHGEGQPAPGAEAAEPARWGPAATEARTPQSPRSATREDAARSPHSTAAQQPPLATTGESPHASEETQHSQKQFKKICVYIWRRQWHPAPVLLPGKSHGWRSLVAAVHGVAKGQTRLSDFTVTFYFHALYIG